jgi:hypothetical protein
MANGGAGPLTMEVSMLTEQGGAVAAASVVSSPAVGVHRQPTLRESVAAFQQRLRGPPDHQRQFVLCVWDSTRCLRGVGVYCVTGAEI